MTTSRLFPSTSGPSSGTSYTGDWIGGIAFTVTQPCWFEGYYQWVAASGQDTTGPFKCGLWMMTGQGTGSLVSGSAATAASFVAGQWNFVPVSTPIMLGIGGGYIAAVGWTAASGFADTSNSFSSGDTYQNGISEGILFAFSDGTGASNKVPLGFAQGQFSTAGTDGSLVMPNTGSNDANFWVDVQVSDAAPNNYAGTYRIWANMGIADAVEASLGQGAGTSGATDDLGANYIVATEILTSQSCTLDKIWFYSHPSCTQLPTDSVIYEVTSQTVVSGTHNASPSWKTAAGGTGSAGGGWLYCDYTSAGVTLPSGDYKVCVYNGAASPQSFNAFEIGFFASDSGSGLGLSNIVFGPLTVPSTANATGAQQATYATNSGGITYPNTYVAVEGQSYFVEMEVTPLTGPSLAFSNVKVGASASLAITGDTANTVRQVQIGYPDGSVETVPVTTDGSGDATVGFVPQSAGLYSANVLSVPAAVVTATARTSQI